MIIHGNNRQQVEVGESQRHGAPKKDNTEYLEIDRVSLTHRDLSSPDERILRDLSGKIHSRLNPSLEKLTKAADRAGVCLVPGNSAVNYKLSGHTEIDEGGIASRGIDENGKKIWVVEQKFDFKGIDAHLGKSVVDGFLTGRARGSKENGPDIKIVAVKRKGAWEEAALKPERGTANPFDDPTVNRIIIEVGNMHPVPVIGKLLPAGSFHAMIDRSSIIRDRDRAELTFHFINPNGESGPIPGTLSGAKKIRATRLGGNSVRMEGYYVIREPREYLDAMTDSLPLGKESKSMFNLAFKLYRFTPIGLITAPLASAMGKVAGGIADASIGATGLPFAAGTKLHALFYRTILTPNLLGL